MTVGRIYPSESQIFYDEQTGTQIRQVTAYPAIHHHPFYYIPCFDDNMARLIFISHRTGSPQIFAELQTDYRLIQLTDVSHLYEWSVHPSHDGKFVYFFAGTSACRVNTETQEIDTLKDFGSNLPKTEGMVGAAMGTTALSHDDRYWAVPVAATAGKQLFIFDTDSGKHDCILDQPVIGHPEFHPNDSDWLRYAGPHAARMWVIKRDGSQHRLVYERDEAAKEWIVHETWRPHSRELLVTKWPHGMVGVNVDSGHVRKVCSFNAWHASINRQGTLMCADTTYPDIGLQLFDPLGNSSTPATLCLSKSSNEGAHWNTDHCPYDDLNGPRPGQVYAPQHTHPHPAFSPDGRKVIFTSDRTGNAQVYEAKIPEELLA